jgi:hypothetical protein
MGWEPAQRASGTGWMVPYLGALMEDPYDAVRLIAARSLATVPGFERTGFDPLAPPESRAAAVEALAARWSSLRSAPDGRGEATLFDAQGRLRTDEVARLSAARDDRPLNLAE